MTDEKVSSAAAQLWPNAACLPIWRGIAPLPVQGVPKNGYPVLFSG